MEARFPCTPSPGSVDRAQDGPERYQALAELLRFDRSRVIGAPKVWLCERKYSPFEEKHRKPVARF